MGQIKKIEIICFPCHKCDLLKERIEVIIACLEFKYGRKMKYEFIHQDGKKEILAALLQYGYTIKNLPITLINGEIAFLGHVKGENVIRWKLEDILKTD